MQARQMRVALNASFWDQPATGSGQYVRQLVRALRRVAPELDLVLITSQSENRQPGTDNQFPISNLQSPISNLHKVWFEQVAFPRACRRAGAHVAHVPYFAPPLCSSISTVVTVHDVIPLILPAYRGSLMVRLYMALASVAAHRAYAIIADSECSKRDIARVLGVPPERVEVIFLAADETFSPVTDADQLDGICRRYGLPSRYLLYLGGFDQRKNLEVLMRAYALALAAAPDLPPLVVAGRLPERDTPFAPDPRRLARQAGLAETSVHFIGWVDDADKPALYSGALAFVFPSRYEGFGLPPLEAMACGAPVICSAAASLPEVVGEAGILVPPDDISALANAIHRLASAPALQAELSACGRQQAARFTWERTARATLDVYRRVAGGLPAIS